VTGLRSYPVNVRCTAKLDDNEFEQVTLTAS